MLSLWTMPFLLTVPLSTQTEYSGNPEELHVGNPVKWAAISFTETYLLKHFCSLNRIRFCRTATSTS